MQQEDEKRKRKAEDHVAGIARSVYYLEDIFLL
jgi:hypothetical protein